MSSATLLNTRRQRDDGGLTPAWNRNESVDDVALAVRGRIDIRKRVLIALVGWNRPTVRRGKAHWMDRSHRSRSTRRLPSLPCIFTGSGFVIEHVEKAREAGWFTFEALEYRPRPVSMGPKHYKIADLCRTGAEALGEPLLYRQFRHPFSRRRRCWQHRSYLWRRSKGCSG